MSGKIPLVVFYVLLGFSFQENLNEPEKKFQNIYNKRCYQHIVIGGTDIPVRTPEGRNVSEKELEMIKWVIKSDFLVNDDTIGGCDQYYPSVAMDSAGNFVIVWEDKRNGNPDIYGQMFNKDGIPQGSNFRVNDDAGTETQYNPSIAINNGGNFVIVWEDYRNPSTDIYAQIYNADGIPKGTNFKVNDDAGYTGQYFPSIEMDGEGNFVITWHDYRNGNPDIYAQRYDSSGIAQGINFKVNDDPGTSSQYYPSIAMDNSGNFVITWQDYRNGNYDIYAQRYDSVGIAQGINFKVNDDAGTKAQYTPSIVMGTMGNFVITWQDSRNGTFNPDIYAQMYDSLGVIQGTNFKVNDDPGTSSQYYPSIAMDNSGNFVITWQDYRNGNYDIYAQRYNTGGVAQGTNFKVNDDAGTNLQDAPSIAMDNAGKFAIVWEDRRNGNYDIYVQRYNPDGSGEGANLIVNNDTASSYQFYPSIAMNNASKFIITWYDYRNINPDIYAQRYNPNGIPIGANFMVNDDTNATGQEYPSIGINNTGKFVITWHNYRNGNPDIYAQRYDSNGIAQGINFKVNDDPGTSSQYYPSIAMDNSGNFVIVWRDYRNGNYDIYAQRFDSNGVVQGTNFRVNDDAGTSDQDYPSVMMNSESRFVIAWSDKRNGNYDIYAQIYDSIGVAQGTNFRVNDDIGNTRNQYEPSVAMDSAGNFVIVWTDYRNGDLNPDIYGQMFDKDGIPQGSNFRVNDDAGINNQYYPSVAIDPYDSRFVIVWTDFRNPDGDPEIMAQKYEYGSPSGSNIQLNGADLFPYNYQYSSRFSVSCNSNNVVFAWIDNRRHKGWDIYGKLTDWGLTGIEELNPDDILSVYPNPFISSFIVRFSLGKESLVDVSIYDIGGKLVKKRIERFNSGFHTMEIKIEKIPQGIYFVRVNKGGKTITKKVVHIK